MTTSAWPDFAPRPGDFVAVQRRARRIRAVHHAVVAAVGMIVAVVVVVVPSVASSGRGDSQWVDTPGPLPSTHGSTVDRTGDASTTPLPSQATEAPSSPSVRPTGPAPPPLSGASGRLGEAPPAAPATAAFRYVPATAPSDCLARAAEYDRSPVGSESRNWCERYAGADSVMPAAPNDLAFEICRAAGTGRGVLAATGPGMVTLEVRNVYDAAVWSWRGSSAPGAPVTVEPGDCARWTIPWAGVDAAGRPVTDPNLVLDPAFTAANFPGWDLTYDVRVTS